MFVRKLKNDTDKLLFDLKPPSDYAVVMLNDDYTPMDFVIEVLILHFNKTKINANKIMMDIHTKGQARCGVYTKDIAETKIWRASQFIKENKHPLKCVLQKLN